MASYPYLGRSGSCSSGFLGHGYSKAQFNLLRILHLISTTPPTPKLEEISDFSISTGSPELDLNLKLGLPSELGDSESFAENETDSAAVGSNVRRSASHVFVLQELEEEAVVGERSVDVSQVTDARHVQVESFEVVPAGTGRLGVRQRNVKRKEEDSDDVDSNDRVEAAASMSKRHNEKDLLFGSGGGVRSHNNNHDEDGFELLIKAAKLISGRKNELDSEEAEERCLGNELSGQVGTGTSKKRGNSSSSGNHSVDCCVDLEENSPVVRSKRGRNQSLPYRYRDSVMEPLKRSGSGRQPQRLSSTTVSRKRVDRRSQLNGIVM